MSNYLVQNILFKEEDTKTICTKTVLDGGSMLYHILWPPNSTYREHLLQYVNTVREKYSNCHVVFDGYRKPSLKDQEHVGHNHFVKKSENQENATIG